MSQLLEWTKQRCSTCTEIWHMIWFENDGVCPRCRYEKVKRVIAWEPHLTQGGRGSGFRRYI